MASWLRTGKDKEAGAAFHDVYQAQLSKLDLTQVARATEGEIQKSPRPPAAAASRRPKKDEGLAYGYDLAAKSPTCPKVSKEMIKRVQGWKARIEGHPTR